MIRNKEDLTYFLTKDYTNNSEILQMGGVKDCFSQC